MAAPTEAQIQTMIKNAIHVAETLRESVQDGGSSLVSLIETFLQSLKGDTTSAAAVAMDVISEALATGISPANLRAILDPLFCDYARNLGFPEKEAEDILERLYVDFDTNSKSVKTRGITFGTPTFSGATGNGVINRITVDGFNRNIEARSASSLSKASMFYMDCGLIHGIDFEGRPRRRLSGDILKLGVPKHVPWLRPIRGLPVVKSGRTTGVTYGVVVWVQPRHGASS